MVKCAALQNDVMLTRKGVTTYTGNVKKYDNNHMLKTKGSGKLFMEG